MSVAIADLGGAVADFPEVITSNLLSQNISIFENKGNESNGDWRGLTGKLGTEPDDPPVVITINFPQFPGFDHYTHVIVAEDLDGDDKTDLALGSMDDDSVWILINQGTGTINDQYFESPVDLFVASGADVTSLTAGFFDDGDSVDLAVAMQDERLAVFLNDGFGVFAHMTGSPFDLDEVGGQAFGEAIASGDLTGEGDEDLTIGVQFGVSESENRPRVSVMLAAGGGFDEPLGESPVGLPEVNDADTVPSVDMADIDGNGSLDIVAAHKFADSVVVILNELAPPFSEDCNNNQIPDECDNFAGQVVYVDDSVTGGDGTSWATHRDYLSGLPIESSVTRH